MCFTEVRSSPLLTAQRSQGDSWLAAHPVDSYNPLGGNWAPLQDANGRKPDNPWLFMWDLVEEAMKVGQRWGMNSSREKRSSCSKCYLAWANQQLAQWESQQRLLPVSDTCASTVRFGSSEGGSDSAPWSTSSCKKRETEAQKGKEKSTPATPRKCWSLQNQGLPHTHPRARAFNPCSSCQGEWGELLKTLSLHVEVQIHECLF